jgi:3-oxoacyl-[acyl-carrier-protein] synthase-3
MTSTPGIARGGFARVTAIESLLSEGAADVHTSDLAERVAVRLFDRVDVSPDAIDFLVLCTETPDFALPTTACMVQARLGVPRDSGALDITHGAAGFAYGLGLAKALIESGQAERVLLVTADTRSKAADRFATASGTVEDAATATLVEKTVGEVEHIAGVSLGTDGHRRAAANAFDGRVTALVRQVLASAQRPASDVDLLLLHTASSPDVISPDFSREQVVVSADQIDRGSSAIPVALADAIARGNLPSGSRVVIAGVDDGPSSGGALLTW